MADDIKLPEPVAWRYVPSAVWRGYAYTDLQAMAAKAEALGCNPEPLYTADQLRAVISAALASRPYKLPPMPAVFQHMPPLPPPFRAGGQQIADDGNDKVFCDLWERGQVEAHARAAEIDMLRDWEHAASARSEALATHLRYVIEIARTWQPDYATKMDLDAIAQAEAAINAHGDE